MKKDDLIKCVYVGVDDDLTYNKQYRVISKIDEYVVVSDDTGEEGIYLASKFQIVFPFSLGQNCTYALENREGPFSYLPFDLLEDEDVTVVNAIMGLFKKFQLEDSDKRRILYFLADKYESN